MQIEILSKNDLTEEQQEAVIALRYAVYPQLAASSEPRPIAWAETVWSVLIHDDNNKLVSYVGALTREGTLNGQPVLVGGIGSVKTDPEARGRGYAGAGLRRAIAFLADRFQVDFSLLVCREALLTYYQRFGWQHFKGNLLVEQPSGKAKFTFNEVMVLAGRKNAPVDGVLDICGMPW